MKNKVPIIISVVIIILSLVILAPIFITQYENITKYSSEKCEELGGEYTSEFIGPTHCFLIEDGKLVDAFGE